MARLITTPAELVAIRPDGSTRPVSRPFAPEVPVALEYNGLSYAVMMASPFSLEDFVTGFALTEGLAPQADHVTGIDIVETDLGWIARATITSLALEKLQERVRTRVAESSCGLCGIDNLEAVARPLPPVQSHGPLDPTAIFTALAGLRDHQPGNRATGGMHAAAFVGPDGSIELAREDVGRHNALDKLVGAMARAGLDPAQGFILSTARCSYEIVEKAVRAGATTLVTISVPTSMAAARAQTAGLSLYALARPDEVLRVTPA
ncbi:MAG: formate dehydrogenase accessory sulfurtransferase FdhD [Alphaproteobacteria bacterium]|nr:formate dehydrogenase accessory sulfurtransferase FdhD [Alphaproteobacteria bacterium]MBU0792940.1 formate dehydrogenase accessory sulfurtransferase FdhD [Alphaproteobacteria bacterium]MBU0875971.1 formate dehydrogenase accessory sulfurtransferase FdhD [Alphaproteobacteria bacterium]MBU1770466.1 formate dehydrogenase accessory sulfurtransferase FdhD [Alphaproteobacteria bacterium]